MLRNGVTCQQVGALGIGVTTTRSTPLAPGPVRETARTSTSRSRAPGYREEIWTAVRRKRVGGGDRGPAGLPAGRERLGKDTDFNASSDNPTALVTFQTGSKDQTISTLPQNVLSLLKG